MKHLKFLTALSLAFIGLVVGMLVGSPYVCAGAGAALAFGSNNSSAVMIHRAGLDLSDVVADLENFWRKHNNEIWVQILKGVDFEQYMQKVPNITGDYITTSSSRSEFLQPYQKGFQPKGGVALKPYTNKCRFIKVDYLEDNLPELFGTYLAYLADERVTPDKYPFVKWLVEKHLIPGMQDEFRILSVKGAYAAPTPGTAGASITSTDGIFTIVTNEIANAEITPFTTGVITPANIVDLMEDFVDQIPYEYRSLNDNIFIADDLLLAYKKAYRDQFGTNQDFDGPTAKVWGTNKTLVGLPQHNGSQRILYTPDKNMLCLYNEFMIKKPTIQLENRDVKLLTEMHRGYGFKTLSTVYVNDQA
jgi:hypothetical protein